MQTRKTNPWRIAALIAATSAALVLSSNRTPILAAPANAASSGDQAVVQLSTHLVQNKILIGSEGKISLALDLTAVDIPLPADRPRQRIDLAVVLDRSGSMQGQKLDYARRALTRMLDWLAPEDRLALVVYDDKVQTLLPLMPLDRTHGRRYAAVVQQIQAGNSTNLGGGLQAGIEALLGVAGEGRQRKVVLISDGLANYGITNPAELGRMASSAAAQRVAISTVGVGYDFNESLMTALADHGAGRYHFLENPEAFAAVLEHEFQSTRNVAAAGLEIRIPQNNGLRVVDAGGYPVYNEGHMAVIQLGDLRSAEKRRIFLTLQLSTQRPVQHTIDGVTLRYRHDGQPGNLVSDKVLTVQCVADEKAVRASIDGEVWSSQVVQEDFGRLKESVADAIAKGEKKQALKAIEDYELRNSTINSSIGSQKVADNIENALPDLRQSVEDTFSGAPAAVMEKQKKSSKSLQYEGYQSRRAKE